MLAKEYEPAVTAVLSKSIVTVDVEPDVAIALDKPVPPAITTESLFKIESAVPESAPRVHS